MANTTKSYMVVSINIQRTGKELKYEIPEDSLGLVSTFLDTLESLDRDVDKLRAEINVLNDRIGDLKGAVES